MHDLTIRDAVVIDGTGSPPREADVAVEHGRIVAVGEVGAARQVIEAAGMALAPGFIDAHTHDDGALLRHPDMWFKSSQGVTTVVVGNCGFSAAGSVDSPATQALLGTTEGWPDLESHRRAVESAGCAVNAIALIGHNSLREGLMGLDERPATPRELDVLRRAVGVSMQQGAAGFSTGLLYPPGRAAPEEELVALAEVAAQHGGLYVSHIRDEFDGLLDAVAEAIRIGESAGAPVHVSHHKAAGSANWGRVRTSLRMASEHAPGGDPVTFDAYPYTAGSGPLALYFRDGIDLALAEVMAIASCRDRPEYEGRMLRDIADAEGRPVEHVVRDLLALPEAARTLSLQFIAAEEDIEENLRSPRVMIGSDGIPDLDGMPHPRLFGTFPRTLGWYVRERGVADLAEMVRRMTSLPARRFGLRDRGLIAPDHVADLVVFDPARIRDVATYEDPKRVAEGVGPVLVAGEVVWDGARATAARPGRVLRADR